MSHLIGPEESRGAKALPTLSPHRRVGTQERQRRILKRQARLRHGVEQSRRRLGRDSHQRLHTPLHQGGEGSAGAVDHCDAAGVGASVSLMLLVSCFCLCKPRHGKERPR